MADTSSRDERQMSRVQPTSVEAIRAQLNNMPIPSHLTEREYRHSTREWLDREQLLLDHLDAHVEKARTEIGRRVLAEAEVERLTAERDALRNLLRSAPDEKKRRWMLARWMLADPEHRGPQP